MFSPTRWFWPLLSFLAAAAGLLACTGAEPVDPQTAQAILLDSWQANQHVVWEIVWPAAPLGGPLTVATWRTGPRYRLEILEAVAPDLVGQTLVFNGEKAWRFNRFEPQATLLPPTEARLSPVTDAFAVITRLLAGTPTAARQEQVQIKQKSVQKIVLSFPNDDHITFWRDEATGLPVQVKFVTGQQQATLHARSVKPLLDPPAELFAP